MPDTVPLTIRDVKLAYVMNAGYDLPDGGLTMAYAFIKAARQLLVLQSHHVAHGGRAEEIEVDQTLLERQIAACQRWIYFQQGAQQSQNIRVMRRGEPFIPIYPGPYYGD
jgi:hypothetical protein